MPHKGLGKCLPLWQGAQVAADTTLVSPVTRAGDAQPNADRIAGTRWTGMLAVAAQSALATKPPLGDLLANARDAGAVPVSRLRLKDDRGSRRSGARGRTSVGGRMFAPRLSPCARVTLLTKAVGREDRGAGMPAIRTATPVVLLSPCIDKRRSLGSP